MRANGARRAARSIFKVLASFAGISFCGMLALYLYASWSLPSVNTLKTPDGLSLLIGREEEPAAQSVPLPLRDIPPHVVNAFITAHDPDFTDKNFFNDSGFFVTSLSKRMLRARGERYGYVQDMVLQTNIKLLLSREEILSAWLATAYFGKNTYGIQAAAQKYCNKPLAELSIREAAMLAPIPATPSLNPVDQPAQAEERQRAVLDKMVERGWADAADVDVFK